MLLNGVNSFVIMEKKTPDVSNSQSDRKLQICLDPRDLNEALEREPYYTRPIEEIMTRFHGMTRFTIADFNKGYWMVELNPESHKYTTMALDIGRYSSGKGYQWDQLLLRMCFKGNSMPFSLIYQVSQELLMTW